MDTELANRQELVKQFGSVSLVRYNYPGPDFSRCLTDPSKPWNQDKQIARKRISKGDLNLGEETNSRG
jgi:hypothetical protein